MSLCSWCWNPGHILPDCPELHRDLSPREPEQPSTADDAMSALNDRCGRQRLYIGALERLLRKSDVVIPDDVRAFAPDPESDE